MCIENVHLCVCVCVCVCVCERERERERERESERELAHTLYVCVKCYVLSVHVPKSLSEYKHVLILFLIHSR